MTGNELVSWTKHDRQRSFLVCKGKLGEAPAVPPDAGCAVARGTGRKLARTGGDAAADSAARRHGDRQLAAVDAMHAYVEGRLDEATFHETADDAVRLVAAAQERAGADVITDGEQRRDSYASFVATRLENCQLIPLTDLLPLVDDPEEFEQELRALDVPAGEIRHPAVFGRLARKRPIALHELNFVRGLTARPVKIALPGPYLLTRTMWMECISDQAYASREDIAEDIVRVLREEIADLLHAGAALVAARRTGSVRSRVQRRQE